MSFTTTPMIGNRVLVSGTDSFGVTGKEILDSTQWVGINEHKEFDQASASFDQAVEDFFAPIIEAAEAMHKTLDKPTVDSIDYVVLHEAVEGVPAQRGELVKLNRDSVVLRLIEQGDFARLVWVNDSLEVLEVAVNVAPSVPTAAQVTELGADAIGSVEL